MRNPIQFRRSRLAPIAVVSISAVALGIVGLTAMPANAAASDVAEAEGQTITGGGTINLNDVAELLAAYSATPSGASTATSTADLTALNTVNLNLGSGVQLPAGTVLGDLIDAGADGQYASTDTTGAAYAAAGALSQAGAIDTSAGGNPADDASVNLTPVLNAVPAASSLISTLSLDLGAISASATGAAGTTAGGTGDYQVSGGSLELTSPAVQTLDSGLKSTLTGVTGVLNAAIGQSGVLTTVSDSVTGVLSPALAAISDLTLGAVTVTTPPATISLQSGDLANVLSDVDSVTSTDGAVTIDLATGKVDVDLTKLLADDPDFAPSPAGTLDGLPANTHLLSTPIVSSALDGDVTQVINQLLTNVETAATTALDNETLTVDMDPSIDSALLGNIASVDLSITGTVGGFLGISGAAAPTATTDVNVLSSVPVVGTLVSTLITPIIDGALSSTVVDGVASTIGAVLNPLLATDLTGPLAAVGNTADALLTDPSTGLLPVLELIIDPVINVQQTPGVFTTPGAGSPAGVAAFTERAIQLNLLPDATTGTPLASLSLANASVRSTAQTASITASAASVEPGDSESISGSAFTPNTPVTITFTDAAGTTLGTTTATPGADGTFSGADWTVPAGTADGTVTATATQGSGAGEISATTTFAVAAASGTATSGTATSGTATSGTATSGTATSGTATSGTATSGTATSGTATSGTATSGTATAGTATAGTATTGTATSGTATSGTATSGTATSGTATSGTATTGTATSGTATAGTATAGTATTGTATSGTATSGTATSGTATAGTATAGTATTGTATSGTATSGTATSGTATAGTATSGTATAGTATSGTATSGTATAGTATSGTATTGTATSGTATSGTATSGTATAGTATTGTATTGTATSGTTTNGAVTPGKVTISGTPQVGNTLVAEPGTWKPSGTTLTYSWALPDGTVIGTGQTLVVPSSAAGKKITLTVTGSKPGYTSAKGQAQVSIPTPTKPKVTRIYGADRYQTAVAISRSTFPVAGSARVVFIATGQNFPDALSAGPAAAKLDGPLLLTQTDSLNSGTASEIKRLKPAEVIVVGQHNAVSDGVLAAIKKIVPHTVRWGGADRYATSLIIAKDAFGSSKVPSAFVATGVTFPDALSASAYSGAHDMPVLLVNGKSGSLPSGLTSYFKGAKTTTLKIAGGTSAVSVADASALQRATGKVPTRYAGADRYATSIAIDKEFSSAPLVYLATGANFPDALSGAAAAAKNGAPLYVVRPTCVPSAALSQFSAWHTGTIRVLGGPAALDSAVADLKSC